MDVNEEARERLAQAIRDRRLERGLSVRAAALRGGLDRATWTSAESGKRRTAEYHFAGIERALGWAPGSIKAILAGGEPVARSDNAANAHGTVGELQAEIERINGLDLDASAKWRLIQPLHDLLRQATIEQARASQHREES